MREKIRDLLKEAKKKLPENRAREEEILQESNEHEVEELVHGKEGGREITVAYLNVNGVVSGIDELSDYLKENKPDIKGIAETKLSDQLLYRLALITKSI